MIKWDEEVLFCSGDAYFQAMLESVALAKESVWLESYIFKDDKTGRRVVDVLLKAASRGLRVRLLVDGFGSPDFQSTYGGKFSAAGAELKVYNPIYFYSFYHSFHYKWLGKLNRRNHRKTCLIDGQIMYTGSFNITDVHCRSIKQNGAWRDTGIRVSGKETAVAMKAFNHTWNRAGRRTGKKITRFKLFLRTQKVGFSSPVLRINTTKHDRREVYRKLVHVIESSEKKIWITNAYFVPKMKFLWTLMRTARRGIDVRVMVPKVSDVPMVKKATEFYYKMMNGAGIRIFEYERSILHAKTMVIDGWAIVGTSNLNHRSFLHDLELDVILTHASTVAALSGAFIEDLGASLEIKKKAIESRTWIDRILSAFARTFRYWM